MSDLEPFRVTSFAGFVGSVPHVLGYTPSDRQIVVAGILGTQQKGMAVINLDDERATGMSDEDVAMDGVFNEIVPAFERVGVDRYVVFAYGPHADDQANTVADLITRFADTNHYVERIATDADGARSYDIIAGWSRPQPVPDLAAEWVIRGATVAESRDAKVAGFTRDPEHVQSTPLPATEHAQISNMPPSARAEEATRIINDAATPGPDNSAALARLGTLMDTHTFVRDTAMIAASQSPDHADVLLRAFTNAPAEHADVLAASAALSHFLTHGSTLGARTLANQVAPDSPHATLAGLTLELTSLPSSVVKTELLEPMAASVAALKDSADTQWQQQRVRAATFPPPGTTKTTGTEHTQRPHTGPDQNPTRDTGHDK